MISSHVCGVAHSQVTLGMLTYAGGYIPFSGLNLVMYAQTFYFTRNLAVPYFPENYRTVSESFNWVTADVT